MKISLKIKLLVISVIVAMGGSVLLVVNIDLDRVNRIDIAEIREAEYKKAESALKNYTDIATQTIHEKIFASTDNNKLIEKYGKELKNIIDASESIIRTKVDLYKSGRLSLDQAKRQAAADIETIRFDNNSGYIWINDTGLPYPKMVMHPISPTLNNQVLDNKKYEVALGKNQNLFQAFVEVALKDGEGFVDYVWSKPTPTGLEEGVPKLSYVKLIPEFDWVIGSGIYIDDAIKEAKQEALDIIKSMKYSDGVGYFWVNDMQTPIPNMVMHPVSPTLDGKKLDDAKYNKTIGTDENIFKTMVQVVNKDQKGYVEYLWPKTPGGPEVHKLSFVEGIKEWGWIIGTGFYIDDIEKLVEERTLKVEENLALLNGLTLIIAIILSIILIIITSLYVGNLVKPLDNAGKLLEEMSKGEGDLTKRLSTRTNDEVGFLSKQFNNFVGKLIKIVVNIRNASIETENVKEDLIVHTESMSSEASDINSKIIDITGNIEALNDNILRADLDISEIINNINILDRTVINESVAIEQSSSAIDIMVESINSVSSITADKNRAVMSLAQNTKNGAEYVDLSTESIEAVFSKVEEIKSITDIITQISSETNLLAMNAAIEAAHAGEYGKGFAVVADEIRKLAENSANSTTLITDLINEVSNKIEASVNHSRNVKDSFNLIDTEVADVSSGLEEITESTNELANGGKEILEALNTLNRIAKEVQSSSSSMKGRSKLMQKAMNQATLKSNEVSAAIGYITQSSENISEIVDQVIEDNKILDRTTKTLKTEIRQFKTE
ncbi:MAG: cache domain-containing protein [Spirochaetaceae bacterium]